MFFLGTIGMPLPGNSACKDANRGLHENFPRGRNSMVFEFCRTTLPVAVYWYAFVDFFRKAATGN